MPAGDLAEWLADTTDGLTAGARLGLRIEPVPSPAMDADDIRGEEDEAGADGSEPADVVRGNRITAGRLQLRLGRDLRWYPYARSDQDWEPSGAPETDPVLALANL